MKRLRLDWTLPSGINLVIRSYADWCTYNDLFINGEYRRAIQEVLETHKLNAPNDVLRFLDLGANVGYFHLQCADLFLQRHEQGRIKIVSVEACARTAAELTARLNFPNERIQASVVHGLAGRRIGEGVLNLARENTINFVGRSSQRSFWKRVGGFEKVPYVDLDVLTEDMPVIDLLKCDIEGSEFKVIENYAGLLRKTQRLAIEFHAHFGNIASAAGKLSKLGFRQVEALRETSDNPVIYFAR